MKTVIDGVQVTTTGELTEEELSAYVQRGREKYGRALISVELKPDGEYMDICYHTQKMPFERIRRIIHGAPYSSQKDKTSNKEQPDLPNMLPVTQKWMTRFGIGKGIKIKSVSGAAFSVNILDDLHQKEGINLVDMGIGYIQLILLLLKLNTFISRNRRKKNKTTLIIIEEPEQNLHPRLQSMLTDLFASIHEEYGIRFLIETHSEYIIRAAQVKVGDSEYNSQEQLDVECPFTVYYFPEDDIPYDMGFTTTGKFTREFRQGFFDEAGKLFMNVLKRERKE